MTTGTDTLSRRRFTPIGTTAPLRRRPAIAVREFTPGAGELTVARFVDIGARLQALTPGRIVADRQTTASRLRPSFHFHAYGAACHFIASREGVDVGRVSAMANSRATSEDGRPVGYVGMFECVDDETVAHVLLDCAAGWLRQRGCERIVGPVDFSTWYTYRNSLGPFDTPSLLMEPQTPEHYDRHWQSFGFEHSHTYFSAEIEDVAGMVRYARPRLAEALEAGFTFRMMDGNRRDEALQHVHELSVAEFTSNVHYSHVDLDEFTAMYAGTRNSLDPRFLTFAIAPSGEVAGFVFSVPNYAAAAHALAGRSDLRHKLRALAAKRHADSVIVKTVAVRSEYRSWGLGTVLVGRAHQTAIDLGYRKVHHALMHETNVSRRISENGGGVLCRRYALYELADRGGHTPDPGERELVLTRKYAP